MGVCSLHYTPKECNWVVTTLLLLWIVLCLIAFLLSNRSFLWFFLIFQVLKGKQLEDKSAEENVILQMKLEQDSLKIQLREAQDKLEKSKRDLQTEIKNHSMTRDELQAMKKVRNSNSTGWNPLLNLVSLQFTGKINLRGSDGDRKSQSQVHWITEKEVSGKWNRGFLGAELGENREFLCGWIRGK